MVGDFGDDVRVGGNDALFGGHNYAAGSVTNNMSGGGGNDVLVGGSNSGAGLVTNSLHDWHGNDTLQGGGNTGSGLVSNQFSSGTLQAGGSNIGTGRVSNDFGGDQRGNTLIAGTSSALGQVENNMWGGAGRDWFVFEDSWWTGGLLTVGTYNTVHDFTQGQDRIRFSHIAGVSKFSDLQFLPSGNGIQIVAGDVEVHLDNFFGLLTTRDIQIIP